MNVFLPGGGDCAKAKPATTIKTPSSTSFFMNGKGGSAPNAFWGDTVECGLAAILNIALGARDPPESLVLFSLFFVFFALVVLV